LHGIKKTVFREKPFHLCLNTEALSLRHTVRLVTNFQFGGSSQISRSVMIAASWS
jgi:hypothetical protein